MQAISFFILKLTVTSQTMFSDYYEVLVLIKKALTNEIA